jgi:hypothetical protein
VTAKLNQVVRASTTFPDKFVEGGLKGRKIDVCEAAGLLQAHRACEYPLGHRLVDHAEAKLLPPYQHRKGHHVADDRDVPEKGPLDPTASAVFGLTPGATPPSLAPATAW